MNWMPQNQVGSGICQSHSQPNQSRGWYDDWTQANTPERGPPCENRLAITLPGLVYGQCHSTRTLPVNLDQTSHCGSWGVSDHRVYHSELFCENFALAETQTSKFEMSCDDQLPEYLAFSSSSTDCFSARISFWRRIPEDCSSERLQKPYMASPSLGWGTSLNLADCNRDRQWTYWHDASKKFWFSSSPLRMYGKPMAIQRLISTNHFQVQNSSMENAEIGEAEKFFPSAKRVVADLNERNNDSHACSQIQSEPVSIRA